MTLSAGGRLGPYEILEPLGAGGTGELYRAKATRFDRIVAIKVLPAELLADSELRQRLERESKPDNRIGSPVCGPRPRTALPTNPRVSCVAGGLLGFEQRGGARVAGGHGL